MKKKDREIIYMNAPACIECMCYKCDEKNGGRCRPCDECMGSIISCPVWPKEKLKGEKSQ